MPTKMLSKSSGFNLGSIENFATNGIERRKTVPANTEPMEKSKQPINFHANPEMRISHAMAVATSALYGIKLVAIGLSFPLAFLIMYNTTSAFSVSIYRGYPIYLCLLGIGFCVLYLTNICFNKKQPNTGDVPNGVFGMVGSKGLRTLTAGFGVISTFWFLLVFAWTVDILRRNPIECRSHMIEAFVFLLTAIFTLLHTALLFINSKVVTLVHEGIVLFGIMHLIGTNLSSWAWMSAHFVVLTVSKLEGNISSTEFPCVFGSPLGDVVFGSHSYLGVFVLIYFLSTAAMHFTSFAYRYQRGSFGVKNKLVSAKSFEFKSLISNYWPSLIISFLLSALSTAFVIYHYVLITKGSVNEATALMNVTSTSLKFASMLIVTSLLVVQNLNAQDADRQILLETLLICISLFGTYLADVCKCIVNYRLTNYYRTLSAMNFSVDIFETSLQAAFLLCALKVDAKRIGSKLQHRYEKNCLICILTFNVVMFVFDLMQQDDAIYGDVYSSALDNVWFWAVLKFYVNPLVLLFRIYSAIFIGSLLVRDDDDT